MNCFAAAGDVSVDVSVDVSIGVSIDVKKLEDILKGSRGTIISKRNYTVT